MTENPSLSPSLPAPVWPANGAAPLAHLGVLRVAGADARIFLHAQLTQDIALLDDAHARLAAHLSPKGRMLSSLIALHRGGDEFLLILSADLLAATLKRLSMYKLRAKVVIEDASAAYPLWGLVGDAARALLPAGSPPWSRADQGSASAIALYPAAGQPRALWLAPADAPPPAAAPLPAPLWLWSEVVSGVATLSAPWVDTLVPQMLNYESIGGVSFKKGCYPGQEVVARSQFRGAIKRRTALVQADAPLAAGAEVLDADGSSVGSVLQSAAAPDGRWNALAVLQTSAAGGPLRVGEVPLALLPLPYALLEDI